MDNDTARIESLMKALRLTIDAATVAIAKHDLTGNQEDYAHADFLITKVNLLKDMLQSAAD
jgi:hypothetical protein